MLTTENMSFAQVSTTHPPFLTSKHDHHILKSFKFYAICVSIEAILLIIAAVRSLIIVKRHTPFTVCYMIIGIIICSNLFFLIAGAILLFTNDLYSQGTLISEAVCICLIQLNDIVNIIFVRKQWLTTRKLLYRQAITKDSQNYFAKQIRYHRWSFDILSIFILVFVCLCTWAYYKINDKY